MNNFSLTVVVPALNEELNLEATIRNIDAVVRRYFQDWEILIFNDGSLDSTGRIAERLAKADSHIHVVHHPTPRNLGACYKEGIELARMEYLIMIPGDNECGVDYMSAVFERAGRSDMIIPFTANQSVRPKIRQWLSHLFVWLVNGCSGVQLKYYNGAVLHRNSLLKGLSIETDGFGYQAEILVKLILRGYRYEEVAAPIHYRPFGKSKAIRIKSLLAMVGFLGFLIQLRVVQNRGADRWAEMPE